MGQFKKGKQDTIVIGEGHSLMLGHMPNSIPSDAYSELNFGLNKSGIESYGFWSNSINYNTFYPGVTQEEFMPKDTDFIEPVYRLLSEVIVNKEWNPVDFSRNGALKASLKMLVGQTVNCDHSTDVANAIGSVKQTFWQESFKQDGIVIPAGINGVLKIDAKANPRLARGILMDPPSIHSNSVSVRFIWDKSHPNLDEDEFWSKLGTYDEKGNLICRVVKEIVSYYETSLVSHGADPFAQKIDENGNINDPKFASKQSYSANRGNDIEYYFMDYKKLIDTESINNTTVFNMKSDNSSDHSNNKNSINMKEKELLALLVGTGMLTLAEGKEVNLDNVKEAVTSLVALKNSLETQGEELNNSKTGLESKVTELTAKVTELENAAQVNKVMAELGANYLKSLQESTVETYKKIYGEKADEAIVTLITGTSDVAQLTALKKTYDAELEKQFPLTCSACGSHDVTRASSQAEDEEGTTSTDKPKSLQDIARNIASNKNKGSIIFK